MDASRKDVRSRRRFARARPRWSGALLRIVGLTGLPLGCVQALGIDVLPIYPSEAGAGDTGSVGPSHDAEPERDADRRDSVSDGMACNPTPQTVKLSGKPVSATENNLTFTPGPSYKLERRPLHGNEASHDSEWVVLATIPACSAVADYAYHDDGQDETPYDTTEAGLESNWQYTYDLTVVDEKTGKPDPNYAALSIDLWTWSNPGSPRADASASDSVTARDP